MAKHSVIAGFLGKTRDRFHEYQQERTLREKFELAQQLEGIDAVEIVFPYETSNPVELNRLKTDCGVELSAINVNIKAEPEFTDGSLTSPDEAVRGKAIQFIRDAKGFAAAVGADKVTCCPLADGYEFSFQTDYRQAWRWMVESVAEAAGHRTDIPLYLEYKPFETRGRCVLDSAAKTLLLIRDAAAPALGVTLDIGHSFCAGEHPSEALSLLVLQDVPYYVHVNDNDGRWDWDYMVGTKHLLEFVEFIYYLQKYGYADYITSDTSPTRLDVRETFEANARWTNRIWRALEGIDRAAFEKLIAARDFARTWRFVETEIFSLGQGRSD